MDRDLVGTGHQHHRPVRHGSTTRGPKCLDQLQRLDKPWIAQKAILGLVEQIETKLP